MSEKRKPRARKCRCCGRWFQPDPRNAWHQRYCTRKACQKVRQRRSHRLWLRKNPGWWHGDERTGYVRDWRRAHPKYWRKVMRRSCATEMLRAGAGMYHVKEMLGHESLDTLKHYAPSTKLRTSKLTITDLQTTHRKCHPREKDEE